MTISIKLSYIAVLWEKVYLIKFILTAPHLLVLLRDVPSFIFDHWIKKKIVFMLLKKKNLSYIRGMPLLMFRNSKIMILVFCMTNSKSCLDDLRDEWQYCEKIQRGFQFFEDMFRTFLPETGFGSPIFEPLASVWND